MIFNSFSLFNSDFCKGMFFLYLFLQGSEIRKSYEFIEASILPWKDNFCDGEGREFN